MTIVSYPQTSLGSKSFTGNGVATSDDYAPGEGLSVAVSVVADQAGTAQLFEVYEDGVAHSLGAAVAFNANNGAGAAAEIHVVDYPTKVLRLVFTNTNNTAGTASFRAVRA